MKSVKFWFLSYGCCLRTLDMHFICLISVAYSPDGNKLATGSSDHTAKIWNLQTGECINIDDRVCARMNITGVSGLSDSQKTILEIMGAVDSQCGAEKS